MSDKTNHKSRRWLMKAGALTSGALALGLPGSVAAQQDEESGDTESQHALLFKDEFNAGAVFRVSSPELQDAPPVENEEMIADYSVRVIQYFNTNEEAYLFVPQGQQVEEGDLYKFADWAGVESFKGGDGGALDLGPELVQVPFRPLGQENFPFDLEEADGFEILEEGGGEAAVRPENFFSGALFRITSGPQGWVPDDVADSGFFTEYVTVHATYLGSDDEFLFFPQEDADFEPGRLYVIWDEFELFEPEGNLVAAEFDAVDQESFTVDDEFL